MRWFQSLRIGGILLMLVAFLLGLLSAGLWLQSNARWQAHLEAAQFAGAVLYDSFQSGARPPPGVKVRQLPDADQLLAEKGQFERISTIFRPIIVTNISILPSLSGARSSAPLALAILSPDLRYPLARLSSRPDQSPSEALAALTRLLASYCSDPVLIAKSGQSPWIEIDGTLLWGCSASPSDLRLPAALLALFAIGILSTIVLNTSAQFADFAETLGERHRLGGPETYETNGPRELRDIVSAVNEYLAIERDRLAKRATVLSGVSHDLGTPATRLRLRSSLIADASLRSKFEADIDRMTGIIESVLTYTRVELDAEAPRRISLTSLIDSIVADYQDIGSPVEFRGAEKVIVQGGQSLFMSRRGTGALPDDRKVILTARPVSLTRAISNLIDNALKYGRRATVGLETDAEKAIIIVEDEGTDVTVSDVEKLMSPFQRGANTQMIEGFGLGLTIAAAVASLHGGHLTFEQGNKGLLAKIRIQRE